MRYTASVHCEVLETRWFHKHVLRRKAVRHCLFYGVPESINMMRGVGVKSTCAIELKDPLDDLLDFQPMQEMHLPPEYVPGSGFRTVPRSGP